VLPPLIFLVKKNEKIFSEKIKRIKFSKKSILLKKFIELKLLKKQLFQYIKTPALFKEGKLV